MSDLKAGHWYFMFTCAHCAERQALFADLSNGTSETRGRYMATCERCHRSGKYDADAIERYHHQPDTILL